MARLRSLLLLSAGLLASEASAQNSTNPGLHVLAVQAGLLWFGTATDTNLFNDSAYMRLVNNRNEFGILVPENSQKWEPTEPTEGTFNFVNPDRVRNLARANTQQFRCHTLTWFQQLPDFVTATAWTKPDLTEAINTHIASVVGHFAGQCYSWDVVNEALNDNGTFRTSVFFNTLGKDYIPLSFAAAAQADPAAKLYYNDFNLESNGNKTAAALDIVRLVRDAGERIDGVGFQAHMVVGQTPSRSQFATVLRRFTALGLEVALTELDVRFNQLPVNSTSLMNQQSTDYVSMVGACVDVDGCVGVVVWEFTDKYSWIPATFPGAGAACLFDERMVRKPAYTALEVMLQQASVSGTSGANNTGGGSQTGAIGPTPTQTPLEAAGAGRPAVALGALAVLVGALVVY